jgi:dienelactone hydrolase
MSSQLPIFGAVTWLMAVLAFAQELAPVEGTTPLIIEGDLSAQMVDGISRWLDAETDRAKEGRRAKWQLDVSSQEAWAKSLAPKRELLKAIIGAVDQRQSGAFEVVTNPIEAPRRVEWNFTVERVRWPVFDGVHGEGLLLRPKGAAKAAVIALPDADQTPEQLGGLQPGLADSAQFARRLAEQGALVVVMTLLDRSDRWSGNERLGRFTNQTHREWIYRQSFELGRSPLGYEVQKIAAAVDILRGPAAALLTSNAPIGVAGYGTGGRLALLASAVDERLHATFVSGAFGPREQMWREPIDGNLQGFLREFGDAELAAMISPRKLVIEDAPSPAVTGPPAPRAGRNGAAPGQIMAPTPDEVRATAMEARHIAPSGNSIVTSHITLNIDGSSDPTSPSQPALAPGASRVFEKLLEALGLPVIAREVLSQQPLFDQGAIDARQRRTVLELEEYSQRIFRESERQRKARSIWTKLSTGAEWDAVQRKGRTEFWENVIGKLSTDYLPTNPRTRHIYDREKWRGYNVVLDVHPDVFAWGVLLVPKDLKSGERRPVVVCQHGLEGVPADTITEDQSAQAWKYYKGFAAQLADRGFIVYSPHNPYRGQEKFRNLQRKANPLGLSLFSFIIAQHDVTTRWLASLPFVDPERIGFYGLSYGGKTAMRVPAVLDRYCLSICSGDFNEWVLKCVSDTHPSGYIFSPEWEIWEWDLAHTFNYAEMSLLIAPRPFMVERGHEDGVGLDEHVGYEWAKVLRGYTKRGIPDRAEIEWFDGPHTIHGEGTFRFLHKWLRWPER